MGRLDNKVAFVSGAARGMGQSHCRVFAAEGAKVVVADILDYEGAAVAAEIGPNAVYQHLDVTSEDEWAAAMDMVMDTFGRLDVLVNSIHPGFIRTHMGSSDVMTPEEVHEHLEEYSARMAPMGRAGGPEEISRLALFLASDESSYSTGSEFVSDGGYTAGYPSPGVQPL